MLAWRLTRSRMPRRTSSVFLLRLGQADPGQEIVEQGAEMFEIDREIYHSGRQRKWHGGVACGLWILDDHRAAGVLDIHRAHRTIGAGAG